MKRNDGIPFVYKEYSTGGEKTAIILRIISSVMK